MTTLQEKFNPKNKISQYLTFHKVVRSLTGHKNIFDPIVKRLNTSSIEKEKHTGNTKPIRCAMVV